MEDMALIHGHTKLPNGVCELRVAIDIHDIHTHKSAFWVSVQKGIVKPYLMYYSAKGGTKLKSN